LVTLKVQIARKHLNYFLNIYFDEFGIRLLAYAYYGSIDFSCLHIPQ